MQILSISLLLTALSLFVRTPRSTTSFANSTHSLLSSALRLSPKGSTQLKELTGYLPRTASPILLLLRLPLLILAVRQQVFLRPTPPYIAGNGGVRILHSVKSITGQIVVGEHLETGYRFLRCDASLLGGRWQRDAENRIRPDLGDSYVACASTLLNRAGSFPHSLYKRLECSPFGQMRTRVWQRRFQ